MLLLKNSVITIGFVNMLFEKISDETAIENGLVCKPKKRNGLIKGLVKSFLIAMVGITCFGFVGRQFFSFSPGLPSNKCSEVRVEVNQVEFSFAPICIRMGNVMANRTHRQKDSSPLVRTKDAVKNGDDDTNPKIPNADVTFVRSAPDSNALNVTVNITQGTHYGEGQAYSEDANFFNSSYTFPATFKFYNQLLYPWPKVLGKQLSLSIQGIPFQYIGVNLNLGKPIVGYKAEGKSAPGSYKGAPFTYLGSFVWSK